MIKRFMYLLRRIPPFPSPRKLEHCEKIPDSVERMKQRAKRYEEATGVALKDGVEDDDIICWDDEFTSNDHRESARRCLAKFRHIDPKGLSHQKLAMLLKQLRGYKEVSAHDPRDLNAIIDSWIVLHAEEVDKITFSNVASYEP